jgi:DNA-directed RNA polymerase subunit M/transcription elongation factor TFIIS
MKKIIEWTVWFDGGGRKNLTDDELERMMKSNMTKGTNRPKWQADDSSWLFLEKIFMIIPSKHEEVEDVVEVEEEQESDMKEVSFDNQTDEEKLKMMMELSSCTHEEEALYQQDTKTGLKYFPVCTKCGRRGRFVAAGKLSDDEKNAAKEWKE